MEPQGPLDPQIYWRRRMAAGGGALVLLIVLIIIIAVSCGGGSGAGSDDPEDTAALPVTTSSAAPSTSAEPSKDPEATDPKDRDDAEDEDAPKTETPPGYCSEDVLAVTVTPDQTNYAVGDKPKFVMAITNSGIAECDVDVSEHLRGITVTTLAGDPVWALWDCNEPIEEEVRTLTPERRQISYETAWAGTTSVLGCTPEERRPVEPGEYAVTANLGSLTSAPVTFNVV